MLLLSHIQPDCTVLNQLVRDRAGLHRVSDSPRLLLST
jgi:hypothetical protein